MAKLDARNSGTFKIGGDIEIFASAPAPCALPVKASEVHRKTQQKRSEL